MSGIKVMDTNGKIWISQTMLSKLNNHDLIIERLPDGLYYIELELEGGETYIDRFIKME